MNKSLIQTLKAKFFQFSSKSDHHVAPPVGGLMKFILSVKSAMKKELKRVTVRFVTAQ